MVRGWHFGRRPGGDDAARARGADRTCAVCLLKALGGTVDPDGAVIALDRALASMPAAIELFSILKSYPSLLALFAEILGSAPRLTDIVGVNPHVLDVVIDPCFVGGAANIDAIGERIVRVA